MSKSYTLTSENPHCPKIKIANPILVLNLVVLSAPSMKIVSAVRQTKICEKSQITRKKPRKCSFAIPVKNIGCFSSLRLGVENLKVSEKKFPGK